MQRSDFECEVPSLINKLRKFFNLILTASYKYLYTYIWYIFNAYWTIYFHVFIYFINYSTLKLRNNFLFFTHCQSVELKDCQVVYHIELFLWNLCSFLTFFFQFFFSFWYLGLKSKNYLTWMSHHGRNSTSSSYRFLCTRFFFYECVKFECS